MRARFASRSRLGGVLVLVSVLVLLGACGHPGSTSVAVGGGPDRHADVAGPGPRPPSAATRPPLQLDEIPASLEHLAGARFAGGWTDRGGTVHLSVTDAATADRVRRSPAFQGLARRGRIVVDVRPFDIDRLEATEKRIGKQLGRLVDQHDAHRRPGEPTASFVAAVDVQHDDVEVLASPALSTMRGRILDVLRPELASREVVVRFDRHDVEIGPK